MAAGLILCGVRCALRQKSLLGRLVCTGAMLAFAWQSLCCLSGSVGVGWLNSLPLPFCGVTAACMNSVYLGLLLASARNGALWQDGPAQTHRFVERDKEGALILRL